MKLFLTVLACLVSVSMFGQSLSTEEANLYDILMEYRASRGLPKIELSKSLTFVAQTHVRDLFDNDPHDGSFGSGCNGHSWSNKGNWSPCCYTKDHARAECMWSKPSELTSYRGHGYEIGHWASGPTTAEEALAGWKKSHPHNQVIINQGIWHDSHWKAIGIGIYKNYAVVWFGEEKDQ